MIDNNLGVAFGLSTLTAAAFGQIFSDVSGAKYKSIEETDAVMCCMTGVCFGGTVEALAVKLGLPPSTLTAKQAPSSLKKAQAV